MKYFTDIPAPARARLLHILKILETQPGTLSSAELESLSGWPRETIRKDISYLGSAPGTHAGYQSGLLIPALRSALGLDRKRKICVVGLGRLGSAFLDAEYSADRREGSPPAYSADRREGSPPAYGDFELAAGFDSNVNRVEILSSPVPLYPAYKLPELAERLGLEIALLCVPAAAAQSAAEKCAASGITGILNFAPVVISLPPQVKVRNVYISDELRLLAIELKNTAVNDGVNKENM